MGLLSTMFCLSNVLMAVIGGGLALLSTRWIMGLGGVCCVAASLLLLRLALIFIRLHHEPIFSGGLHCLDRLAFWTA